MKRRRLLNALNLYNGFLLLYLIIRSIFAAAWWWLALLNTFALWLFMPLLLMIPLALFLSGKRTAAWSLFLLLIGFWKFAPMAEEIANGDPHDIRLLTFNVWKDNQHIAKTVDWILKQNADVVVLEEFIEDHLAELPRLLEIYPFHAYIEYNVQIFSLYPFVETEILQIAEADAEFEGRLALRSVLDIDGKNLAVYGVHLNVPRKENAHFGLATELWPFSFILRYDETRRNRQIHNLAKFIAQEKNPVLLAGDFNTSHSSLILKELSALGLVDTFAQVGSDWGMTWPHLDKLRPVLRIDYIWASPAFRPLRLRRGQFVGSDHLPLIADFAFSTNSPLQSVANES